MRHLSTIFLTATVLAFACASTAVAQPEGETDYVFTPKELHDGEAAEVHNEAKAAEKTPATVPLPEAKKRYQEKERQLRDLAEGKGHFFRHDVELITDHGLERQVPKVARLDVSVADRRDVRNAVAEAFDARQQLQAAELAELERRIASIKRAMALRETMKDSIIDQRTEELIEQIEAAEKQPKQQSSEGARTKSTIPTSQGKTPTYPGASSEIMKRPKGADPFAADDPNVGPQARKRLLQLDVQEAEQALAAAERAYKRGKTLYDTGTMTEDAYDKLSEELNHAKIQLQRAKVKLRAHEESSATLAEKELSAAKLNFKSAEQRYNYAKKMHENGYVTQDDVDVKAETLNAAQARLKHAEAIFEAVGKSAPPADDDGAGTPPAQPDPNNAEPSQRLLELDVEEAEAKLDAAQRDYERVKGLHDTKAVEQSVLDQKVKDHEIAKIQLKRAKVKLEAFENRSNQGSRPAGVTPANGSASEIEANRRLAQLDVEEAEAHLGAAELQYERCKRLYESNSIQKELLDEQADEYKRAQQQFERAKVKLKALSPASTSALDPTQGKQVAAADANDSLTITLIETRDGKPAAVYLEDGKAGTPLVGTPDEQDDQVRQAVEQGVSAGKRKVLIKAEKGVAHRDVLRVSEAAGSVEGVSLHLAVAEGAAGSEQENAR